MCIQNVFGHILYMSRLHLDQNVWQFEVQKLAYMFILAAVVNVPYLSTVTPTVGENREFWLLKTSMIFKVISWDLDGDLSEHITLNIQ